MAYPLVLALGGSLLRPEESERHAWLSSLAKLLLGCEGSIGIVVGGGAAAREAIRNILKGFDCTNAEFAIKARELWR